jgi:hypothetical protein
MVHLPLHASWLNQIEVYFSIVEREMLTPNDFPAPAEVAERVLGFQARYEEMARPFTWKFTRAELAKLRCRLATNDLPAAAVG